MSQDFFVPIPSKNSASVVFQASKYTERQWPLFGVRSIMMVKSAQPGEGGRYTPTPFHSIYHHDITPPISPLPLYVLYVPGRIEVCTASSFFYPDVFFHLPVRLSTCSVTYLST
jgi:hypothetical protein